MNEDFDHEQALSGAVLREVFDWIESAATAIVFVILVFIFAGRLVGVYGESMLPTLEHLDRVVVGHLFYTPKTGDIVVITKPNPRNEPLIKRVVATGGQTLDVDFDANTVTVDGQVLKEPYILEPMEYISDFDFPLTVPEGHVFAMGDNRNNSWDSRAKAVGFIDQRHILGKIVYRVMPYDRIGVPK